MTFVHSYENTASMLAANQKYFLMCYNNITVENMILSVVNNQLGLLNIGGGMTNE